MKKVFIIFVSNLVSILMVCLAGYMVYSNKPNYGWVLFLAAACAVYLKSTK